MGSYHERLIEQTADMAALRPLTILQSTVEGRIARRVMQCRRVSQYISTRRGAKGSRVKEVVGVVVVIDRVAMVSACSKLKEEHVNAKADKASPRDDRQGRSGGKTWKGQALRLAKKMNKFPHDSK